jgi:hypothetical protein
MHFLLEQELVHLHTGKETEEIQATGCFHLHQLGYGPSLLPHHKLSCVLSLTLLAVLPATLAPLVVVVPLVTAT